MSTAALRKQYVLCSQGLNSAGTGRNGVPPPSVYSSRPSVEGNSGTWGDNEAPKSGARRDENRGRRPRQGWGSWGGAKSIFGTF